MLSVEVSLLWAENFSQSLKGSCLYIFLKEKACDFHTMIASSATSKILSLWLDLGFRNTVNSETVVDILFLHSDRHIN